MSEQLRWDLAQAEVTLKQRDDCIALKDRCWQPMAVGWEH